MTICWIITEGLKGTENQCLALAEAAGLNPIVKVVKLRQPWKSITPWIDHFQEKALAPGSSELTAPWPDMIIASGRKSLAPALWVKRQNKGDSKLVVIQNPVVKNKDFDLVIAPQHDQYRGKNVLEIMGALSLITSGKIDQAKTQWQSTFEKLPAPRIAVLIGGNSSTYKFTREIAKNLVDQCKTLIASGHSLMITASRRTPIEMQHKIRDALMHPNVFFWNGHGDNPYIGMLAWADRILVTEDSVSMASEAISTGKPVYIIRLDGGSPRFRRFHDYIVQNGYARIFDGKVENFSYLPPNDLKQAAHRVKSLLQN